MDDLISRAEKALEGVTPGPWVAANDENRTVRGENGLTVGYYFQAANARFIAAARDLVPELVAKLREGAMREMAALGQASEAYDAQLAAEAKLREVTAERPYVIGANDGWDAAVEQGEASDAVKSAMVRFWKRLADVERARADAAEAELARLRAAIHEATDEAERLRGLLGRYGLNVVHAEGVTFARGQNTSDDEAAEVEGMIDKAQAAVSQAIRAKVEGGE